MDKQQRVSPPLVILCAKGSLAFGNQSPSGTQHDTQSSILSTFQLQAFQVHVQLFPCRRGLSDSLGITQGHSLPRWGRGQTYLPKQTLGSFFFLLHLIGSLSGASFDVCGYPKLHALFNMLKLFLLLWTSGQTLIHYTRGHDPSTSSPA